VNVHVIAAPVPMLSGKQLADLHVQIQSEGFNPQFLASSPFVSNAAVVLDWTPTVSGAYVLYVTTTGSQSTDYDGATLGIYNLFVTQLTLPTPSPVPTSDRGRPTTPTAMPGERGRLTPSITPTSTPTPTPTPGPRPRVVGFR